MPLCSPEDICNIDIEISSAGLKNEVIMFQNWFLISDLKLKVISGMLVAAILSLGLWEADVIKVII